MKRCLALLMCLSLPLHAGVQKQESKAAVITSSTKQAFDKNGDVDLVPLVDLKVGDTVAFKVDNEIVVGTVTRQSITPEEGLKLFGEFGTSNKAGFLFHFGSQNTVKGMLFFADKNTIYNLSVDGEGKRIIFEKQIIAPRESIPNTTSELVK